MSMNAQDILTAAADLIEEKGAITQCGEYYDEYTDCYCALGAIAKVTGYNFSLDAWSGSVSLHLVDDGARTEAAQTLAEHLGFESWHAIPDWNDRDVSGWQDVVHAMRGAASS